MMIHPSTRDESAPYEPADRPSPDEYRDDRTPAEIAAMAAANPAPVSSDDFAPRNRDGSIFVLPADHYDDVPF